MPNGRGSPLSLHRGRELLVVTRSGEVGHPLLEERAGIRDGLIVDRRPELGEDEVEEEPGLQLPDLLIHLPGAIRTESGDGLLPCVVRHRDRRSCPHD